MSSYSGEQLGTVNLIVDAVYRGYKTDKGGMADPLVKLIGVSRQGGFRYRGTRDHPSLVVLTSNLAEADWPDELDPTTGRFVYYGDNKHPGCQLHDTPRFGNHLLKNLFDLVHGGRRAEIPPILIFTSESPGQLIRTKAEQLPVNDEDQALIKVIKDRYRNNAFGFEACAGAITKLLLGNVARLDLTRPWRDGGRDGIGTLRLGRGAASIEVAFALEAKCYSLGSSVGVREVSRLISRIKHREFGVLVTTSYVDRQAYQEVVDDGHPVIFITAIDIIRLLREAGYSTSSLVNEWLDGLSLLKPS